MAAGIETGQMAASDALVAYRTYPHIDLAVTGARCLPLLERRMEGLPVAKAWRPVDFLIPLPWQCSASWTRAPASPTKSWCATAETDRLDPRGLSPRECAGKVQGPLTFRLELPRRSTGLW